MVLTHHALPHKALPCRQSGAVNRYHLIIAYPRLDVPRYISKRTHNLNHE